MWVSECLIWINWIWNYIKWQLMQDTLDKYWTILASTIMNGNEEVLVLDNSHIEILDWIQEPNSENDLYGILEEVYEPWRPLVISAIEKINNVKDLMKFEEEYLHYIRYWQNNNRPEIVARKNIISALKLFWFEEIIFWNFNLMLWTMDKDSNWNFIIVSDNQYTLWRIGHNKWLID